MSRRRPTMRYILPCFLDASIRRYHQAPVEALLDDFARTHAAAPVTVGGFGHFDEDVIYVTVTPSAAVRGRPRRPRRALRRAPRLALDAVEPARRREPPAPHDGGRVLPLQRFAEVWGFVQPAARRFDGALDNLTLLRQAGEEDGITRWAVHRAFPLGGVAGASPPP